MDLCISNNNDDDDNDNGGKLLSDWGRGAAGLGQLGRNLQWAANVWDVVRLHVVPVSSRCHSDRCIAVINSLRLRLSAILSLLPFCLCLSSVHLCVFSTEIRNKNETSPGASLLTLSFIWIVSLRLPFLTIRWENMEVGGSSAGCHMQQLSPLSLQLRAISLFIYM